MPGGERLWPAGFLLLRWKCARVRAREHPVRVFAMCASVHVYVYIYTHAHSRTRTRVHTRTHTQTHMMLVLVILSSIGQFHNLVRCRFLNVVQAPAHQAKTNNLSDITLSQ